MELNKVIAFNKDQVEHIRLVQEQILDFCKLLMYNGILHDQTKFEEKEYAAFIDARDSLRGSDTGQDADYQKHLKSDAIQSHINNNPHHPEHWTAQNKEMPLHQAIIMYMDWKSRCIAKGTDMSGFWDYNMAKLEKQPRAKAVCELLRNFFND